ncbi:hypothetical protein DRO54_03690 [Candidatus Bathyarchaeota archaeon]|nr:MAG: hypothetical protein DRO54_03690 [Candidatus Bathyarchaeota archaeon]
MKNESKYEWKGALKAILVIAVLFGAIGIGIAAWDDTKSTGDTLTAAEWNAMVADQKNRTAAGAYTYLVGVNTANDSVQGDTGYWVKNSSGKVVFTESSSNNAENAIQYAIDNLPSGGGKVELTEGTFIQSDRVNMADYVELYGQGWATILKFADGITPDFCLIESSNPAASHFTIRNMQLDCNKGNVNDPGDHTQAGGIHLSGASDFIIENLYVHDSWYRGISGYGVQNGLIRGNTITDCEQESINLDYGSFDIPTCDNRVEGNYIFGNGSSSTGICVDGAFGYNLRNIIVNNIVTGAYNGVKLTNANVQECIVSNNHLRSCTYAINANGLHSVIANNIIYRTFNTAIEIGGRGNRVIGNFIVKPEYNKPIYVTGKYNHIISNMIQGGRVDGIVVDGSFNIINENICLRTHDTGISVGDSAHYNEIKNNICLNPDSASTHLAEAVSSGAAEITVDDSSIFDIGTKIKISETGKSDSYCWIKRIHGNVLQLETGVSDDYSTSATVYNYDGYYSHIVTGISISSGATNNKVEGNRLYNIGTPLNDNGTETRIRGNIGYRTDSFKATSQSVSVGVSDTYGEATDIKSPSGIISALKVCKIVIGGSFAVDENVTVKVETNWDSGNTAYIEKTYTNTGTNYLDIDGQDGLDLWRDSDTCTSIKLYAKSDQASTSVTVTCDLAGTG